MRERGNDGVHGYCARMRRMRKSTFFHANQSCDDRWKSVVLLALAKVMACFHHGSEMLQSHRMRRWIYVDERGMWSAWAYLGVGSSAGPSGGR